MTIGGIGATLLLSNITILNANVNFENISKKIQNHTKKLSENTSELGDIAKAVNEAANNAKSQLEMYATSQPDVIKIRSQLDKYRNNFNSYSTIRDVERAYMIMLIEQGKPLNYHYYLTAFRLYGIKEHATPSVEDLRSWDNNAEKMYELWQSVIVKLNGNVEKDSVHRYWGTFDSTFTGWRYGEEKLTYKKLRNIIKKNLETHIKQKELNVQIEN